MGAKREVVRIDVDVSPAAGHFGMSAADVRKALESGRMRVGLMVGFAGIDAPHAVVRERSPRWSIPVLPDGDCEER